MDAHTMLLLPSMPGLRPAATAPASPSWTLIHVAAARHYQIEVSHVNTSLAIMDTEPMRLRRRHGRRL